MERLEEAVEWPDEFGREAHYIMIDEDGREFTEETGK
jgi:hypothetical protein